MVTLKVDKLSFGYSGHPVLDNISFEVGEGEFIGLVGANGSGKTTAIKCINRILHPDGGRVELDGSDIKELDRLEIARRIAYVPQSNSTVSAATVFELILMGRRPYLNWKVRSEDEGAVINAMEMLGIEMFAFRKVRELSGGERQRVMIARALAQGAPLLLLDEPTSALDIRNQIEVMELVHELTEAENISVVMAIHDLNIAARYCDRLVILNHGNVHCTGTPGNVLTEEVIRDVYGVDAMIGQDRDENPYVIPLRSLGR